MPYVRVTPERLQRFLDRLGQEFRNPGRVYLVGGTGLLFEGLKGATKEIDLTAQIPASDREAFTRTLIRLRNKLQIAIEEVSPGDFIPLPSGVEERHRYLGRTGQLEIFAFDPVSTALAKLARARVQDVNDVLALVQGGRLPLDTLAAAFEEIIPRVAVEALTITEGDYRLKFAAFMDLAIQRQTEAPQPEQPGRQESGPD